MNIPYARSDMPTRKLFHRHVITMCRFHRHIPKLDAAIAANLKEPRYGG